MQHRDDDSGSTTLVYVRARSTAATGTTSAGGSGSVSPSESDTLWDVNDVARFFKVSRSWVYRRAEAGLLPYVRVGGLLQRRWVGGRGEIRTHYPRLRRPVLYPDELRTREENAERVVFTPRRARAQAG